MGSIALNNGLAYLGEKLQKINIRIQGNKIVELSSEKLDAKTVIDCSNNWIVPGGIDPHVHFRCPGGEDKEDWISGSQAAVSAGITTVFDMPNTNPPTTTIERLNEKRKLVKKDSIVNFAFHFGASPKNLDEMDKVEQVPSIKIYFGSTTGNLLVNDEPYIARIMKKTRFPLTFHAEDDRVMLKNKARAKELNISGSKIHGFIRDENVASSAVKKILSIAKGYHCKIYICHISTIKELELIQNAKKNMEVYCEASPHHLFLNEELFDRIGNFAKVNPPLRKEKDRIAIYNALLNKQIDTIGTDHAPHQKKEKELDYLKAPSGLPGVENTFPLLLTEVYNEKLSITDFVKLTSQKTAQIFSVKNKAEIKLGYDADLTIVNPKEKYELRSSNALTKAGWNPFDGKIVFGKVLQTIVMGELAYNMGNCYKNRGTEVIFESYK